MSELISSSFHLPLCSSKLAVVLLEGPFFPGCVCLGLLSFPSLPSHCKKFLPYRPVMFIFGSFSPSYSALENQGFEIMERGEIEVKGKGKMTTYFLIQNLNASEDEIMGRAPSALDDKG